MDSSQFPTHRQSSEFWENLGRAIATFGFLEEVLGKAIFVITATRKYPENEIEEAFDAWLPTLEHALTDQLTNLAEKYGKVIKDNPEFDETDIDALVYEIKEASKIRNVLCHGSWRPSSSENISRPLFINRQLEIFETDLDIKFFKQTQDHVSKLALSVIHPVTEKGYHFPGSSG